MILLRMCVGAWGFEPTRGKCERRMLLALSSFFLCCGCQASWHELEFVVDFYWWSVDLNNVTAGKKRCFQLIKGSDWLFLGFGNLIGLFC